MKKSIFTGLFLIFTCLLPAQSVLKSFPEKIPNKYVDYEILGKNDFGILVHYYGPNDHGVAVYNENLRPVAKQIIDVNEKRAVIERLVPMGDQIIAFYSTVENGFIYLKAKKINRAFEISVDPIIIDSLPRSAWDGIQPYYIKASNDNSKIMVFYILSKKSDVLEVHMNILDAALQRLTRFTMIEEGKDEKVLKSVKLTDKGNIVAVVAHLSRRLGDSEIFTANKYGVHTYNFELNKQFHSTIEEEDYLYKDVITGIDNETGLMYLAGMYQHRKNREDIGLLIQNLGTGSEMAPVQKLPYTDTEIMQAQSYSFRNWYEKAEIVKPKSILPRSDGGMILVTEAEYQYTRVVRTPTAAYSIYSADQTLHYYDQNHYYDISLYSISPQYNVDWKALLPKSQVSEGDAGLYSSYTMFQARNVLKFLFNEDISQSGNYLEYNVNPRGEIKRASLLNTEKEDLLLIPQKAKQLPGNMVIIPGQNKKNMQYVLIKY